MLNTFIKRVLLASGGYFTRYAQARKEAGIKWWLELVVIATFYVIYSIIRNVFGSGSVSWEVAFRNAERVIEFEKFFGTFQELRIQQWFIDFKPFIWFMNFFYGFFHFAATTAVLVWMYVRRPQIFARWRTVGLITTGLGLVGYALFPLMPPRLLGASIADGGADMLDVYGFVDTVKEIGGLWSYNSGAFQDLSNQYAAMPSMHFAWALWCCLILYSNMRFNATRLLVAIYPFATLVSIVVTANHYWIDALGGAGALLIGYFLGTKIHEMWSTWRTSRSAGSTNTQTSAHQSLLHQSSSHQFSSNQSSRPSAHLLF